MNKVIFAILASVIIFSAAGCGKEEETADSYADKLVSGEVQPRTVYSDDEDDGGEAAAVTEEAEPSGQTEEVKVSIGISDEEMAAFIDEAAAEYSSFEFMPIESEDFFLNKDLRMAASVQDHEMSRIYSANIKTKFTNDAMIMEYPSEGQSVRNEYYVYTVSDEVKTTPNGNEYTYVAYGAEPITSSETAGTIGVIGRIKMTGSVDMGEAAADSYILLIETSNAGVYELFKEE